MSPSPPTNPADNRGIVALIILLVTFALVFVWLRRLEPPASANGRIPANSVHVQAMQQAKRDSLVALPPSMEGVVNGIDTATGLIAAPGLDLVKANCLSCHSTKLITQYRGTREDWLSKIRWMQAKQNLWDLGENEPVILEYLSKNYAPHEIFDRRPPLQDIEWYELE